jgi:hypothetical protein
LGWFVRGCKEHVSVSSRFFLGAVAIGFLVVAGLIISANVYTDVYGLFRPVSGRSLPIYGEERTTKYLYSYRYIPEGFDGILLGSSVSDNLDLKLLQPHRIYNASINGGNVEDIRPIAENALKDAKLRYVIICAHRYITRDHVQKTDLMTPRQYWSALGSPQLMSAYVSRAANRMRLTRNPFDDWGTNHFNESNGKSSQEVIREALVELSRGSKEIENYDVDPVALNEFRDVIKFAHRYDRRVVVFFPPIPQKIFEIRASDFAKYRSTILGLLDPSDIVIDFNSPTYAAFRSDYGNYRDYSHLSEKGAQTVVEEIGRALGVGSLGPEREGRQVTELK